MKTFADIKRRLQVGVTLTMIGNDWYPNGILIGKSRKIKTKQTNAIQFEPLNAESTGSWLHLDKPSCDYIPVSENEFKVALNADKGEFMYYRIEGA